jgi:transglutaminase/protease-like cytokinesis protein 3
LTKAATMKKTISQLKNTFILLLLLVSASSYSQYEKVDAKVRTYPKSFSNPKQFADKINADFKTDTDKARAIFTWAAINIRYDLRAFYTQENGGIAYSYNSPEDKIRKDKAFRMDLVTKTLRSGKGVCEGYASLLTVVGEMTGLQAVIIPGTAKTHQSQIGKLPKASDHAWNAVKINGKWQLIDITWAAGIVNSATNKFEQHFNDVYFLTDPDKFFLNHFPDDEKWLLTDKSAEDFAALPFYYPEYLRSDYSLNADEGHILFPKNVAVKFNIQNLQQTDRVSYITSKDNMLDVLPVDSQNNFVIYPSTKLSGYLTIFVNEKPLVSYKIVRS